MEGWLLVRSGLLQGAVSTHHVGSHRPGYRGETRLALTDRAAGFLVCGFQKKAPKRLLVGAKAGKS